MFKSASSPEIVESSLEKVSVLVVVTSEDNLTTTSSPYSYEPRNGESNSGGNSEP